jgi:hypothetical protein
MAREQKPKRGLFKRLRERRQRRAERALEHRVRSGHRDPAQDKGVERSLGKF